MATTGPKACAEKSDCLVSVLRTVHGKKREELMVKLYADVITKARQAICMKQGRKGSAKEGAASSRISEYKSSHCKATAQ